MSPSPDTWLKLHTSILMSSRFTALPSNDHRWAFVCLLILSKKRLESLPERQLLGHLNVSLRRWRTIQKDLVKSGLLGADGKVNGFDDSQLSPGAARQRRYRRRHSDVTGDESVTPPMTIEAEAEVYKNKNPLTPKPKTARKRSGVAVDEKAIEVARAVAGAFNDHFGKQRDWENKSLVKAVRTAMTEVPDATPDDFANVIRMRINERWVTSDTLIVSMIRKADIAGHIERVKEHAAKPKYVNF